MASQAEITATYDYLDEFWRATFGENPDITAALYDGDYSKSLDQAQWDKHTYILDALRVGVNSRLLDIGCGWGGLLQRVKARGARGVGLTLSPRQAESCRRTGLDVRLCDWKTASRETLGPFDAVACVGAFEHFCSEDEYLAGRQETIYRDFFRLCAELLSAGGRIFLQTMLWGRGVPDPSRISLDAPAYSDEHVLGLLRKFFPGSWLPSSVAQILSAAQPSFAIVSTKDGRLDYIETMNQWAKRARPVRVKQLVAALRIGARVITDRSMYHRLQSMYRSSNQECFRRELMHHQRIVLEKRPVAAT